MDRNFLELLPWGAGGVALRKESVDRNRLIRSLLALLIVALRKESVDRNSMSPIDVMSVSGRSPQGERG